MLRIESRFFVAGVCGREITDFLLDCTDDRYRQWWPGTHLELHALSRRRGHVGDIVLMDESTSGSIGCGCRPPSFRSCRVRRSSGS
jgi:hypothetical protein